MIRHTITVFAIIFFMVSCETKNKESIMDKYDGAVISTKFGDIVLEFFDDTAPKHVESFKLHAQNGYYDGTTFHRVIPGFMIQGGDPLTKSEDRGRHGTGGNAAKYFGIGTETEESTWDLPAEFNSTPMREEFYPWQDHKIQTVEEVSFLYVLQMPVFWITSIRFLER